MSDAIFIGPPTGYSESVNPYELVRFQTGNTQYWVRITPNGLLEVAAYWGQLRVAPIGTGKIYIDSVRGDREVPV